MSNTHFGFSSCDQFLFERNEIYLRMFCDIIFLSGNSCCSEALIIRRQFVNIWFASNFPAFPCFETFRVHNDLCTLSCFCNIIAQKLWWRRQNEVIFYFQISPNDSKHLPSHLILHLPPILPLPQYVLSFIWNGMLFWCDGLGHNSSQKLWNFPIEKKIPEISHSFGIHVRMHLADILIFFSYQSCFQPRSYTSLFGKISKEKPNSNIIYCRMKINANHLQLDSIVRLNLCLSTSSRARSHFRKTLALTVAKQIIVTNRSAVCDAI